MLTAKEKELVRSVLTLISEDDIFSLCQTVTQNMIIPNSLQDAVDTILIHSSSIQSLLRRRKVSKEVLFKFLHELKVDIPSTTEKPALITTVISLLNKSDVPYQSHVSTILQNEPVCGEPAPCSEQIKASSQELQEMAVKFSEWFYTMLNSNHNDRSRPSVIGTEHFWSDCSIYLTLVSAGESVNHEVNSDDTGTVQLLNEIILQHKLYFNPNLTREGVRAKSDPHGLVTVVVCGTLHQEDTCVGVFEQLFALVRDPFSSNNWKIKYTRAVFRSKSIVTVQPILQDGDLAHNVLAITDSS